ncbi:MAG: hypothetical protein H6900_06240 [Rhodobacter sp.]|uniref:hypothetical protein n=1 Tax=Pararhodobacter sp. TaxID=2127056 RepID=UPI001D958909|nr:hypothetical protein [Pararhodobacter sp.]MCB1346659.1 hypothetical protein [Paracoccaceae bacterium]MCC0072874.1 hypothetical protein [Rhodobacter sp.]HPD91989.1 hypothetical protein [Pararhodobacter sp.]
MMLRLVPRLALCLLLAAPAGALTLDTMQGRWRGEGDLRLGDEPAQRFRCQIRLRPIEPGQSFFSGRCATAQAAQSFTYMLFEGADGALRAENRAEGDSELPAVMQGRAAEGLLRFEGGEGALFELRRDGGTLRFVLAGTDSRGPARGEAVLTPQE